MRASFIQSREVHFSLPYRAATNLPVAPERGPLNFRLPVQDARALMFALRDALREAGEEV